MNALLSAIIAALFSLFGLHQSLAHTAPPNSPPVAAASEDASASLAAAAALAGGMQTSSSTSSAETSAQTSVKTVATSANDASTNSPIIASVFENQPPVETNFVTQSELASSLTALTDSLTAKLSQPAVAAIPQNVAAEGNPANPFAAENAIDNLSNVTISNATISNSNISGGSSQNDLPLSGGTITGDLVIDGSATTTMNAYFANDVGIGTTSPGSIFSIGGIANWTAATTTYYSTGGINLTGGCFSINGTCITGGGGGSGTVSSGTQGQFAFYNTSGTTVSGTSTLYVAQSGNIGIGTTTPFALLSVFAGGDYGSHTASTIFAIGSTTAGTATTTLFSINNTGVVKLNPASQTGDLVAELGGTSFLTASSTAGNIAIGLNALQSNVSGSGDTALGAYALMFSTSSSQDTAIGRDALSRVDDGAGNADTAVGWRALFNDTTGAGNDAVGANTLEANTAGGNNDAMGDYALQSNTTGGSNVAIGFASLSSNTTGNNNSSFGAGSLHGSTGSQDIALGTNSLFNNTTGDNNVATGYQALKNNTTGNFNSAIGDSSLLNDNAATNTVALGAAAGYGTGGQYYNQGGTYVGNGAGLSLESGSDYNTLLGLGAGANITTGTNNIFLGADSTAAPQFQIAGTNNTLTTGSNNISIGYNISLASTTGSNQLDIANILFGTGVTGTGRTIAGNVGIGTSSPYTRLSVWGTDTASSTLAFNVVNSASTTEFAVFDGGNAELSGTLSQNSDQRLKTNIQSISASSSLAAINALDPVTFNWIDPEKGTTPQLGFIAQQVQQEFPNLVSTTSPTSLTPDGTLSLNYISLISPIVAAIQQLSADIVSIENTVAGFANQFTTNHLTFNRASGQELCLGESNGQQVCVTGDQLAALLAGANVPQSSGGGSGSAQGSSTNTATDTAPQIQVSGDNPAIIQVGATYNDLGATITSPQADLNLGITTYVNGAEMSPVQIDTSAAATDTIDYVVTDQNGLTSTSTRTVIIEAAESTQPPQSGQMNTNDTATSSPSTTDSTSTPATTTPQQQTNTAASSTDATSTQS